MFRKKSVIAVSTAAMLAASAAFALDPVPPARYEAQDAGTFSECPATGDGPACVADHQDASGGKYVNMRGGELNFTVTVPAAGFYTIWARYSQTCDQSKTQNLVVNETPAGVIVFPVTGLITSQTECGPVAFDYFRAAGKVRLNAGPNKVAITNSWGWVSIDYIEVGPHIPEPFNVASSLVNPNATDNARKVYQFMRENFGSKVISGVMTNVTTQYDGLNTPHTINSQHEMKHIKDASGKLPALLGLDYMHSTGLKSDDMWFRGYHGGVQFLAEDIFNAGGIPTICWHWKDPLKDSEDQAFYVYPQNGKGTHFDLGKAYSDAANTVFDVNSAEYKALVADIDQVAGYLKELSDKNIPILWRPLHEAAGGWFWWGSGARDPNPAVAKAAANACKNLWIFMYDRMTNHHGLNNLIWVWTCEEGGSALDWYPGDEYVDIVGRDWYPYPNQREKIHGSLVSNFENLKEIYGGRKIIALSENGPVPHPDSLVNDGAHWSFFMPWYGDFTIGTHDQATNTVAEWNYIMNHPFVITLEDMAAVVGPGWADYQVSTSVFKDGAKTTPGTAVRAPQALVRGKTLRITSPDNSDLRIRVINVQGRTIRTFRAKGSADFSLKNVPAGRYVVEIRRGGGRVSASAVTLK